MDENAGGMGRSRVGPLLIACLLLAAVGVQAEEEPGLDSPSGEVVAQARAHLEGGRAADAIRLLRGALAAEHPPAERALLSALLGEALVRRGEAYAALRWLEDAVVGRGQDEDHLALAEALLGVGRTNAQRSASGWLEIGPYLQDAIASAERAKGETVRRRRQRVVGEAHYWLGERDQALDAWGEEAFQVGLPAEEARRLHDLRARALYAEQRYEESAAAFAAAENLRGEASAWAAAGNGERTIAVYGRVLALDPGNETVLEEALSAARYTGAEAALAGLLADLEATDGPAKAAVLVARGLLAKSTGALDAAERLLERACEADPEGARPLAEAGGLALQRAEGGDEDARDHATRLLLAALDRAPANDSVRRLLWGVAGADYALAWRSARAHERTLRIQQALVDTDPSDGLAWANLGNTLRLAGRHEEALQAYDEALRAEPGDPSVTSDRGLVLSALGRSDEALQAFLEAIAQDSSFDAARQNAARILWHAGRDAEAERHLAAAESSQRAAGGNWLRYRFLLDRIYRTRQRPGAR